MNDFDRAIDSLQRIIDESTNDDGSLNELYEDINLAIDYIKVVKGIKNLMDCGGEGKYEINKENGG